MNKTTLLHKAMMLSVFVFMIGSLVAQPGIIPVDGNSLTKLELNENSYRKLGFSNSVAEIGHREIKTKMGYFTLLSIEGYGYSTTEGDPKLPVLKRLIEVPVDAGYSVELSGGQFVEFNLDDYNIDHQVIPSQPPVSKSIDNPEDLEFIYNASTYAEDNFLGAPMVQVFDLGMMRGVRIARLEIAPVQYNPVQHKVRVYTGFEVLISFKGGDVQSTLASKQKYFSHYYEGIYSMLLNYKSGESEALITDEPVTYVIVSDPMFEQALQPFVEWKTKKGFFVIEAYTDDPNVGNTSTSIKNYLTDIYNNPPQGFNPQSFVLFVGDVNQIDPFNGNAGGHVTDLYFCEYTGDIYPECFSGRFSANNPSELQPQIDKTLEYEQYLMPDPSFLDEVVMVSGADAYHSQTWGNGQINYGTTYYFNAAHGLYSHTYLQPEPGGGNYAQQIRQNVSDGVSYANYTAHCSPSGWADPEFFVSHVSSLSNDGKYPLMVGNCCSSNDFTTTCFGEALLRAANKGALGYIGGTNSTYWDEDYWWGVGFESVSANPVYNPDHLGAYDRTFHDNGEILDEWYVTQGQMSAAGNLAVTQAGSPKETYYWEIYTLMGDPSLMVYFSQPPATTANYQGLMPLGSNSFTVNTDPYAYVAISKEGVLHGAALADDAGVAEVAFFDPITVPGTADVVITRQNGLPYLGTVEVASPNGPYVLFSEMEIDDSNGNNNGMPDFSETILLDVTLENLGNSTASNLTATISTADEYVAIDNNTHTWPNIPSGGSVQQAGAFTVTVDDMIPDMHTTTFDLEVTDGSETWYSSFNMTLHAPVLSIGSFSIDDSNGNNNGQLDPGENVNLIVENTNEGSCDAPSTTVTVSTTSALITLNTTTYDLNTLAAGETKEAVINLTVSSSAQVGDIVNINYLLVSDPYTDNAVISASIGLIVEDFESGDFETYDWEMDGNADWTITNVDPYEGVYSAKSGSVTHYQSSILYIDVEVSTDDQISFFRKVSSEDDYDYLKFYIDGALQAEWSGEVSWEEVSFPVTAGQHTFKWEYYKDVSISSGDDCAWLDYIVFPPIASGPAPLAVVASATPGEICEGESAQLYAFASGGSGNYSFEWTPQTGLNDPNIQNPVASPVTTTTYSVTADDGNSTVTDDVTVTVYPLPETPTITQQGNSLVSSATEGNQWYDSNGMIPGATGQVYYPNATDNYYVIVTSQNGCESDPSNTIYYIYTGIPELFNGEMVNVYPNPVRDKLVIDYAIRSASDVKVILYNSFGQMVRTLSEKSNQKAGTHRIDLKASGLGTGLWFIRIETEEYSVMKKIVSQ